MCVYVVVVAVVVVVVLRNHLPITIKRCQAFFLFSRCSKPASRPHTIVINILNSFIKHSWWSTEFTSRFNITLLSCPILALSVCVTPPLLTDPGASHNYTLTRRSPKGRPGAFIPSEHAQ